MSVQSPSAVVLIRPHHFGPNPATAVDNAFQSIDPTRDAAAIARDAYVESTRLAEALEGAGIQVHLFEDTESVRPDSVFPNNWFSTHPGGRVAVFPMYSPNRRTERRADIIELLKERFRVQDIIDFSGLEQDGLFLEGTGAMVLDHTNRVAYAAASHRADPLALERFCATFGYEPMMFAASDGRGIPIYHTNVMMCIATDFALVGLSLIVDQRRRQEVADRLAEPGRELIDLSDEQVADFAGNAIELRSSDGRILVMSTRAESSLSGAQRAVIERSCRILAVEIPTIELAGGSVRCMIAGIHLDRRPVAPATVAAHTFA
ncbi:citrulline utilization hydrolase CtlX [Salinibacterium sp.]|uniref:citrulline utilization hydrolase CtlX n=1 Tax=Salinibacterium sp. TaxID=1915057 RepID=UPI00286C7863|nr:arginine deiminase-related protein [Salinibacterium sp.]